MTGNAMARAGSTVARWALGALGALLVLLSLAPVFQLLSHPGTGLPGARTVDRSRAILETAWWGGTAMLLAGAALAAVLPVARFRTGLRRFGMALGRPAPWAWALALGTVSAILASGISRLLFDGLPTLEDGMASLVHARYLAGGRMAGALPDPEAAWLIPNTVTTGRGWISQYPPLHVLLLAGGLSVGVPWLVGPLLLGAAVALTCRTAELALGDGSATARAGGMLAATSPFLLFLGAGYLSHTSAAAFGALAVFAALSSLRSPSRVWPILAGVAAGGLVASRPWTGLFLGVALPAGLWAARATLRDGESWRRLASRLGWATAGGLPFAGALGAYNARFFGHPLRFGYTAAYGDAHLPGLHRDPWGNEYGFLEALGYTSADLVALGVHLLETPLPVVAVVGLALLVVPARLPRGTGVLLSWALLPVAANALYWHHGFHLGPRMLYEASPAWAVLVVVTGVALVGSGSGRGSQGPRDEGHRLGSGDGEHRGRPVPVPEGRGPREPIRRGRAGALARDALLLALLLSLPAGALLAIQRARSYAWTPETLARITAPEPPTEAPLLVFVHGSWPERVASRLRSAGVGADTLETVLRRNDLCAVDRWSRALEGRWEGPGRRGAAGGDAVAPGGSEGMASGPTRPPGLSLDPLPGTPAALQLLEAPGGYPVRRDPSVPWDEACLRELRADRNGVVSLAPLLWQGSLPGLDGEAPLFVRDLGPEENREILARWPGRTSYVWMDSGVGDLRLLPYADAVPLLWTTSSR